jgi:hypothetical protein
MNRYIILELEIDEYRGHQKSQDVKVHLDVCLGNKSRQPLFVLTWVGSILVYDPKQ